MTAAAPDPVVFTVAGDLGATEATDRVLTAVAEENADFHLAVGDLSYAERSPESAWCDYVKGYPRRDPPLRDPGRQPRR